LRAERFSNRHHRRGEHAAEVTIDWRFTTADARTTLKRLYPAIQE
jgi:hypothetical protein